MSAPRPQPPCSAPAAPRSQAALASGSPSPPRSHVAAPTICSSSPWVTAWTRQPGRASSSNLPLPDTCRTHLPLTRPQSLQEGPTGAGRASAWLMAVASSLQIPGGEASPCGPPGDRAGRWLSIFGLLTLSCESTAPPASGFGAQGLRPAAKGHVGGPPCPLPPPTPGLLGRLPMDGSWGFPREAQQERGGGRGRKPLELSWNPPDWKGPGQRKGEERGGWAGAPPLGQDWPGSGDSFPEWPLLGPGLPQGTSRAGSRSRASTPPGPGGLGGSWRAACAPGGSGSGLGVLAPVTLVAPAGLARGSLWDPHPPSPSQGHHRLIDLSGHSTLGG